MKSPYTLIEYIATIKTVLFRQNCELIDTLCMIGFITGRKSKFLRTLENFWNQAKRHLRKYNGVPRQNFHLYLKECEWRFNYGAADQLLKTLRTWLKPYSRK